MKVEANNPCCICGSEHSEFVFAKEYPEHGYPGTFSMQKCQSCGLLFNSPRLPDDQFPALYGKNYYFFARNDQKEFLRIINLYYRTVALVGHLIHPRKVIEIGSAKGYLLALLKSCGWDVQGIELSSEASRYAKEQFHVPTFTGTVEEYGATSHQDKFPLVLAIDVIEHVLYPRKFIQRINQIIQADGLLIIDTPNGETSHILTEGSLWKGFNPFHIFLFSPHNLTVLLEDHGYRVEKIFSYENEIHRPPGNFFQKSAFLSRNLIITFLKKLHISNACRIAYQKVCSLSKRKSEESLAHAVRLMQHHFSYDETEDSKKELAQNCRGDNIVVFARKNSFKSLRRNRWNSRLLLPCIMKKKI